jgi:hypothetical protein
LPSRALRIPSKTMRIVLSVLQLLIFFALACTVPAAETAPLRFDRDIRPILADKCYRCHGPDPDQRQADLRLDLEDAARKSAIVPGHSDRSELFKRITTADARRRMPPPDSPSQLSPDEIDLLARWIDEGAEWSRHWAFIPPERSSLPVSLDTSWPRGPIDQFVLARLENEGLTPTQGASLETLIRRVTLALTGLPPTLEEIDAFVQDDSPDAYERVVDRLLESCQFGERMALMWLDAARYGDTSVYHGDGHRDMWAWRDRVVESYNQNLPFDEFSIEQLAGDLLPEAGLPQKVAAAFNRNNGTTDEGGLIEEEYRVEYAVDRVKTTSLVWLGLTMECGQCHDHKYDPISQEDYYRFFAFFNVSADSGNQPRNINAAPLVEIPHTENLAKIPGVIAELEKTKRSLDARRTDAEPEFAAWLRNLKETVATADGYPGPRDPVLHIDFDEDLDEDFDEAKDSTVADRARSGRFGQVRGTTESVDGIAGKARQLKDGANVEVKGPGDFTRQQPFSLGGWIRSAAKPSGTLISRLDKDAAQRGYDLELSLGRPVFKLTHAWPGNTLEVMTKRAIEDEDWHHVFVVYDGSSTSGGVRIYVDGDSWATEIVRNTLTGTIRTDAPVLIGSRPDGYPLTSAIDEIRIFDRTLDPDELRALFSADFTTALLEITPSDRSDEKRDKLRKFYLQHIDRECRALLARKRELEIEDVELRKPLTTVMIMTDMKEPRETFILNRGAYDAPTEHRVEPGTPMVLPPLPSEGARNRLTLARWLFRADHPLTARVAVNQYWQLLFGTGLVATPGDFGSQGEFPSHPELLDWLAMDFRDSGWNVKLMMRQIVTSATYRQSSEAPSDLYRRDPQNRLLARGPRFRLQAEFLRDSALALGGLLVKKFGGPGLKPYQPPGLWNQVALGGDLFFVQDHGEKLYRRSLYTYWKRSAPAPNMQIFDAPTREKCAVERSRTNTPLQALVMLNDVQFVEAARHFARRLILEYGGDTRTLAIRGFRMATARRPSESELTVLIDIYQQSVDKYRADPAAAQKLLSNGDTPRDPSLDIARHAAWTIVASMLLNLDETLTR